MGRPEQAFAQAQIFKDRAGEAGSLIRASHSSHRRLRAALLALRRAARDARIATEHHFVGKSTGQTQQESPAIADGALPRSYAAPLRAR